MPRLHDINRNWVVDSISGPIVRSDGSIIVKSTRLQMVDDAYPVSGVGFSAATLQVTAQVAYSNNYPGGSLSATVMSTLEPNSYVLNVYGSDAGTLAPISGSLTGVTLFILEHGS